MQIQGSTFIVTGGASGLGEGTVRMLAAAGNHCSALQRIAIGRLTLESLQLNEGEWCFLESAELDLLS